jgi:hypothetical protein
VHYSVFFSLILHGTHKGRDEREDRDMTREYREGVLMDKPEVRR